ncbi:MAG: DUF3108 domain-containing protein [Fidelibacterota bacterium]
MRIIITIILLLNFVVGQNFPFQVGEKLVYNAKFNIIPSGIASLEILAHDSINGNGTYHARFTAKTNPTFDPLFKIRDQIDIWMDHKSLYTHQLLKTIREGKYRKNVSTTIDYQDSLAVINSDTVKIYDVVRDPYSLFYYLRTVSLEIGQVIEFKSFENNNTTQFKLHVNGTESVSTEAGTFSCIIVRPYRKGKALLKNKGDMQIWFSNDKNRVPVQIQIKMKFGSMLLKLKEVTVQ